MRRFRRDPRRGQRREGSQEGGLREVETLVEDGHLEGAIQEVADPRGEAIRVEEDPRAMGIPGEAGRQVTETQAVGDHLVVGVRRVVAIRVEEDRRVAAIQEEGDRRAEATPVEEDHQEVEGTTGHLHDHSLAVLDMADHRSGVDHLPAVPRMDGGRTTAYGCIVTTCGISPISIWRHVHGLRLAVSFRTTTSRTSLLLHLRCWRICHPRRRVIRWDTTMAM
jgi:hypothetical protein